jgi:hypothetical protein
MFPKTGRPGHKNAIFCEIKESTDLELQFTLYLRNLSELLIPAKYDRKPNIVGSDELPPPISIPERQRKESHHYHFQHWPYERRFAMCARNFSSCNDQLICMARKCPGRARYDKMHCLPRKKNSSDNLKKRTKVDELVE